VLIKKGLSTGYTGDPEEGINLLSRGLRLIDRKRDPKLVFQALHNFLLFRVDLGEFKNARRQIWDMRPLYTFQGDQIAHLKLRGIEGRVFAGLGELDRAARAFQQAKEGFLKAGLDYDAALISFDLATVWLRERKQEDVRRLLQEMLDTFRARYIAREGIATLIMLRNAANRSELTIDHLERAATLFETLKEGSTSGDVTS
jgi:tetratricopeptide (TPR) repeat protein